MNRSMLLVIILAFCMFVTWGVVNAKNDTHDKQGTHSHTETTFQHGTSIQDCKPVGQLYNKIINRFSNLKNHPTEPVDSTGITFVVFGEKSIIDVLYSPVYGENPDDRILSATGYEGINEVAQTLANDASLKSSPATTVEDVELGVAEFFCAALRTSQAIHSESHLIVDFYIKNDSRKVTIQHSDNLTSEEFQHTWDLSKDGPSWNDYTDLKQNFCEQVKNSFTSQPAVYESCLNSTNE